jgi:hypothetical protein
MTTAYIRADQVRFPARCAGCDAPATTIHELEAKRGYDLLVVAAWEVLDLAVPMCAGCGRRRRVAGIALWTGLVVSILVGGFVAMELRMNDWNASAALLGALVLLLVLVGRFRADHWLEWYTVGLGATLLRGDGMPLRLRFRRPAYAATWRGVNPNAVASRAALTPPTMRTDATVQEFTFTRKVPALSLVLMVALLLAHDWNAVANREVYPGVVLFLCVASGLAFAGTVHPPLFYAVGKYGRGLPTWNKVVAVLATVTGFAIGMYLLFARY